jgi:predicted transcriptional regulator
VTTKVFTAHVPLTLARKVSRKAERHSLTQEALADVDSGRLLDHQAVQAWADSLGTKKPRTDPL